MKTRFQYGTPALSGKAGDLTYCFRKDNGIIYARRNRYPRITDNNHQFGSTVRNLYRIKPSPGYINDLRTYRQAYLKSHPANKAGFNSWGNIYLKLMYEMQRFYPAIDLKSLSRGEITLRDLPCKSVKSSIEAHLLPIVAGWELLDSQI